jgi:hypothetical protein
VIAARRAQRQQAVHDDRPFGLRHLVVLRVRVVAEVGGRPERAAGLAQHLEPLAVQAGFPRQTVVRVEEHDLLDPRRFGAFVDDARTAEVAVPRALEAHARAGRIRHDLAR